MVHYKAKPISRKELSSLARDLRKMLGFENRMYFPILHFIELLPKLDKNFDLEIVGISELPEGTEALTYPDESKMLIREDVYLDAEAGRGRARFTLAHEMLHYLFHSEQNISFARSKMDVPKYMDPEWQADEFAAELLAPGYLIKDMSVEEVSNKFGISYQCASIQLRKHKKN